MSQFVFAVGFVVVLMAGLMDDVAPPLYDGELQPVNRRMIEMIKRQI